MDRPLHPWLEFLRKKFGEHPDYTEVASWLHSETGRDANPESLRLIAQGHRRPGGDLAVAIESACKTKKVTARVLLTWEHYSRQPERAA